MKFFRDDEKLNRLSTDDRIEIFLQVLFGSSDITKELLHNLISDYSVPNLEVIEINEWWQKGIIRQRRKQLLPLMCIAKPLLKVENEQI